MDKINLFKPKINFRKLDFNFTIDGGEETLRYTMHALPNIGTLRFNPNFYKADVVCGSAVLAAFLQYSLRRTTIDIKYLACSDIFSLLPLSWQSEAYKTVNNTQVSLSIEESNSFDTRDTRFNHTAYIGMYSRHEVTVTFVEFDQTFSSIGLIANFGSY